MLLAILAACGPPYIPSTYVPTDTVDTGTSETNDTSEEHEKNDKYDKDSGKGDGADSGKATDSAGPDVVWPVIIIGGGPAGMAVAGELKEALLIEGEAELGGRMPDEGTNLYFIGTSDQEPLDSESAMDEAKRDWIEMTGSAATDATLLYFDESQAIHDQLETIGVEMGPLSTDALLGRPSLKNVNELPTSLQNQLGDGITVWTETWVESIAYDAGQAVGVVVDGQTFDVTAPSAPICWPTGSALCWPIPRPTRSPPSSSWSRRAGWSAGSASDTSSEIRGPPLETNSCAEVGWGHW